MEYKAQETLSRLPVTPPEEKAQANFYPAKPILTTTNQYSTTTDSNFAPALQDLKQQSRTMESNNSVPEVTTVYTTEVPLVQPRESVSANLGGNMDLSGHHDITADKLLQDTTSNTTSTTDKFTTPVKQALSSLTDKSLPPPNLNLISPRPNAITTPSVELTENPSAYISQKSTSLVMWDRPVHSAIFLFGTIGLLIASAYVNPIAAFSAIATLVIAANFIYVNLIVQGGKVLGGNKDVKNPHEKRIHNNSLSLAHERVDRFTLAIVDLVNQVLQEATKIALIEDNVRSLKYLVGSYLTWTLSSYIPAKWIVGTSLILLFTLPKLYTQNKELVDAQVSNSSRIIRQNVDKATVLAKQQGGELYQKGKLMASQLGEKTPLKKKSQ